MTQANERPVNADPVRAAYRYIHVESEGAVDWLTLNRPDRLNAFNDDMVAELWAYFSARQKDHACRVIVLRGAGSGFCAGLDLKALTNIQSAAAEALRVDERKPSLSSLVLLMRACPQPIIALVHGPACGGGFILALAADVRIAGESARMNVAFIRMGLSGCELGTSYFLPRMVGLSIARELMMTGRFIDARRALATGLVSEVTPDTEMETAARALIGEMLNASPTGLRMTKSTLEAALRSDDLQSIIKMEEYTQMMCFQGPDFTEAMTAFAEKRAPRFVAD